MTLKSVSLSSAMFLFYFSFIAVAQGAQSATQAAQPAAQGSQAVQPQAQAAEPPAKLRGFSHGEMNRRRQRV